MAAKEPISIVLERAGVLLTFGAYEIYGISTMDFQIFSGEPATYDVYRTDITFLVATADCLENNIISGLPFTVEDDTYVYSFTTSKKPIPDFTGWSTLYCDFVEKAAL